MLEQGEGYYIWTYIKVSQLHQAQYMHIYMYKHMRISQHTLYGCEIEIFVIILLPWTAVPWEEPIEIVKWKDVFIPPSYA